MHVFIRLLLVYEKINITHIGELGFLFVYFVMVGKYLAVFLGRW